MDAESLERLVNHAEQTHGPGAPVAQHLRKQLAKSEASLDQPKERRFLVGSVATGQA